MARLSFVLALVVMVGCVEAPAPGQCVDRFGENRFIEHSSRAVSVPAAIGTGIGTALGLPFAIIAAPVTIPLGFVANANDPTRSNLDVVVTSLIWPDAVVAVGGAYALGWVPERVVGKDSKNP
ncbi:MAG TPA: hypothetical protein VFF73_37385 [Planctomycetota bacterium]|nr:hypothetical protein [Planctomycetota bacterium]